ncbi:hypothetical protein BCR37DRAFT_379773 [Protomyces lactucae-debilis]|uniref:Uncharacterized protein n=1 Tax=Protomyces lactucae-debilis TaxID=2754530 RepID=A0A1Y2FD81_PROLT|nr:uncharacterized protein BCR37DRAFT_379773 [Protomyces lactucae-debilis]ORY81878.1 hypothetical protein BCR37DRAFT_379773 [Protomyces lactucae-debilis]
MASLPRPCPRRRAVTNLDATAAIDSSTTHNAQTISCQARTRFTHVYGAVCLSSNRAQGPLFWPAFSGATPAYTVIVLALNLADRSAARAPSRAQKNNTWKAAHMGRALTFRSQIVSLRLSERTQDYRSVVMRKFRVSASPSSRQKA